MQNKKIITCFIILIITICISTNKAHAEEKDITQTFIDENLRNSILELAKNATGEQDKTAIYESDIDKIIESPGGTSLKLAGKEIKSLEGIEAFADKEITWIFLDWNQITDLTPLQNFQNLKKISFSGNQIADLTPLAGLNNLENIVAINNNISSIEPLENLVNIKYICLDENKINNIDIIKNWSNVLEISFQNNQIEQLPNLSNLQELETLNVNNNKIKTINTIGTLQKLEKLEVDNNQLTSLEGIQNLKNLKILSCSNNQIIQISGMEQLANLENVNFNKNQIQDITKIQKNPKIKYLYMDNNYILNFDILENLKELSKYTIYNQTISIEVKEKITGETVLVPLPDLFRDLYDTNSYIYHKKLEIQLIGAEEYEIDKQKQNIKLKAEDLERNLVVVQVSDEKNIILKYNIQLDKTPPDVQGVVKNQIYSGPVTPTCGDDDVEEVELTRNGKKINYQLGQTISDKGQYIIIVKDRAGNETRINFEIRYEMPESDEYKVEAQNISGITHKTTLENFRKLLKGQVDYNVYRNNVILKNNQNIATGDKLITEYGRNFNLIVEGDITKDGVSNIVDLVKLRRYILKLDKFDALQKKAADLTEDAKANIVDLVEIRKVILSGK